MNSALAYERRRITSTRSTWILIGLLTVVAVVFLSLITGSGTVETHNVISAPVAFGGFLIAALGAQAIGQEYRFGTIRSTLTLFPVRPRIFSAKLAVALAVALLATVVAVAACLIVARLSGTTLAIDRQNLGVLARTLLVAAGWLLAGFGIAAITRSTILGIVLPLVIALIVEATLAGTLGDNMAWLTDILPFLNANGATGVEPHAWEQLGVFGIWTLAVTTVAYFTFTRRDA